nr:MAG TPA: hypothetical protein [Caudoviricetes sp.]
MHKYRDKNRDISTIYIEMSRCIKSPQLPWTDKVLKTALALPFS